MTQEIADRYMEAFKKEQAFRTTLSKAVTAIESAKGNYDLGAMTAEETAKRILDDGNSGLSPSEKAEWGDRLRNAYKTQAYLQK